MNETLTLVNAGTNMSFTIIGFQVFNLNDYDVKLFAKFEEDQLYIAEFKLLEKFPTQNDTDEGSSQRLDKLQFSNDGKNDILKHFPFSALFKSELTIVKPKSTNLTNFLSLFNNEYNYILNLYTDSQATTKALEDYLTKLGVPVQETTTLNTFIGSMIDQLDEKVFKESLGKNRLQKKVNPRVSKELKILDDHVKIIQDDEKHAEVYRQLIRNFDEEFIHSEVEKFNFDSVITQKSI